MEGSVNNVFTIIVCNFPPSCTSRRWVKQPMNTQGKIPHYIWTFFITTVTLVTCYVAWWSLPELLYWYPIVYQSHCNSFENRVPVHSIYWHPIFKWVAVTWNTRPRNDRPGWYPYWTSRSDIFRHCRILIWWYLSWYLCYLWYLCRGLPTYIGTPSRLVGCRSPRHWRSMRHNVRHMTCQDWRDQPCNGGHAAINHFA